MAIRQRPRRGRFRGAVATQNNVRGFVSTGGKRSRKKLKVGTDIPTAAEMRAIVEATPPRYQTLLKLVALTSMRSSEVRGLRWCDVDFGAKVLHIVQRIDRYGATGEPKSGAGTRTIPLAMPAVKALREWQLKERRPRRVSVPR